MRNPLIVGVDGSDHSLRALDWAVSEAAVHNVPLRLVYASIWDRYAKVLPGFGAGRPSRRVMAEHIVASATERVERLDPDVRVSAAVLAEDPVPALLAEGRAAFALVLGYRGRGDVADMLLGSTSLIVAGQARCPVVVVRGDDSHGAGFSRVTVGVGPAGTSSTAVGFAFREAEVRDAELRALHAWRRPERALPNDAGPSDESSPPEAHAAARTLKGSLDPFIQEHPKVTVSERVPEGWARDALLEASADSDLMVVGAPHRDGMAGMQLGRVNHAVLHHCACPIAVVPQRD